MSLISNALKNLFNLLGQKTPTNNGVTSSDLVPLLNSSHAPKGDVSITDLASVLGGVSTKKFASGKLSDCNEIGFYSIQYSKESDITDLPCTGHAYMLVISIDNSANATKAQFLVSLAQRAFIRVKSGLGWQSWKEITLTTLVQ